MKLYYSLLLEPGKKCDCCGKLLLGNSYISGGAGTSGGIYCSKDCMAQGPVRINQFKSAIAAELKRLRVKFLPLQCVRKIVPQ